MNIKALTTEFQGYHFRSRLEARWACFFDQMNWPYMYEPAGFILPSGEKYLPDFFLPILNMWVEVKADFLEIFDFKRAVELVKGTGKPLLILDSDPAYKMYSVIIPTEEVSEGFVVVDVNLCIDTEGGSRTALNENLYFLKEIDFINGGQTAALTAIKRARAHRFGVFETTN